jgi:hypothetical protein
LQIFCGPYIFAKLRGCKKEKKFIQATFIRKKNVFFSPQLWQLNAKAGKRMSSFHHNSGS